MGNGTVYLGLTGGIGSGKSTVAGMMRDLGAAMVDADAISREITGTHGVALPAIAASFGASVINLNGSLDREAMRDIAFNDVSAKARLESILHPMIRKEMLVRANLAASQGSACIVFDVPLLVESKSWRSVCDWVLVVDCSAETQQARVAARSGLTLIMIQRMMASQVRREMRLRAADLVLFNDGISLAQLARDVKAIAPRIGL